LTSDQTGSRCHTPPMLTCSAASGIRLQVQSVTCRVVVVVVVMFTPSGCTSDDVPWSQYARNRSISQTKRRPQDTRSGFSAFAVGRGRWGCDRRFSPIRRFAGSRFSGISPESDGDFERSGGKSESSAELGDNRPLESRASVIESRSPADLQLAAIRDWPAVLRGRQASPGDRNESLTIPFASP
jgi:hypothetical protein